MNEGSVAARTWLDGGGGWTGLGAEFAALARRIRERRARTVGVLPAARQVAVPAVAVRLGHALAATSVRPVAVIDALGEGAGGRNGRGSNGKVLVTDWIHESLAVLTPTALGAGGALAQLESVLEQDLQAFDHLVFNLSGLDASGEAVAACESLDAVIVLARSGRTTTRHIRRRLRDVPNDRSLGVLLTGT